MKILVLSNTPWSNDNSFGNSFSNIFEGIPDVSFANIYCRHGMPNNQFNMKCFQITEKKLIRNLLNRQIPAGEAVEKASSPSMVNEAVTGFRYGQKKRWQILFWFRDLIWRFGRWNSPKLRTFLDENKPDLIFQPIYYSSYLNRIALFIKKYTNAPMVGYISDDCYTLRQFRFSPLYWIDRLLKRRYVKRVIDKCKILYVISEIQKKEYENIFKIPCKVLTKMVFFNSVAPQWSFNTENLQLLFAGNIGTERWKSLEALGKAIERLNKEGYKCHLDIYTPTPLSGKIKRVLIRSNVSVYPPMSYSKIQLLQQAADIQVHVEGLSLSSRLEVRQSFSTKLVDLFALGKPIFAIGPSDVASISHLLKNDAAIVASDENMIYEKLKNVFIHPKLLQEYGHKAYECGQRNHNRKVMQSELVNDLHHILKDGETVSNESVVEFS